MFDEKIVEKWAGEVVGDEDGPGYDSEEGSEAEWAYYDDETWEWDGTVIPPVQLVPDTALATGDSGIDRTSPNHTQTVDPISEPRTNKRFEYSIAELRHRAKQHISGENSHGAAFVFPGDVYKSDTALSEETRLALIKAVRILEDVPNDEKDWHPGSDGKVLDLVHPSLFPLVYGVSRVLPSGETTTLDDCIAKAGGGVVIRAHFDPFKVEGQDEDDGAEEEGADNNPEEGDGDSINKIGGSDDADSDEEKEDIEDEDEGEEGSNVDGDEKDDASDVVEEDDGNEEWEDEESEGEDDEIDFSYSDLSKAYSKKYQWLPCEVDVSGDRPR